MHSCLNIHVCTSFISSLGTYKKITTTVSPWRIHCSTQSLLPSPFLPLSSFPSLSLPSFPFSFSFAIHTRDLPRSQAPTSFPSFTRGNEATQGQDYEVTQLPSLHNSGGVNFSLHFPQTFSLLLQPFPSPFLPPPSPFPPLFLFFMIPRTKLRQMTPPTHLLEDFSGAVSCPNERLVVVERQLLCWVEHTPPLLPQVLRLQLWMKWTHAVKC